MTRIAQFYTIWHTMNFPVTREYLRTCVREEIIAEKEKRQRYEFYEVLVKRICNDVENMILNNPTRETQYIWKNNIGILGHWRTFLDGRHDPIAYYNGRIKRYDSNYLKDAAVQSYLLEFLEVLKRNFVGCDIVTDPLQTYIMIGWT